MSYYPIFWDIETTGLNPMIEPWSNWGDASQVTAVGLGVVENWHDSPETEDAEITVKALYDSDEYRLLKLVRERVLDMVGEGEPILVGYNSRQYDHPYFTARCGRKRLNPQPFASEWKRLDMMRVAKEDDMIAKAYPKEDEYMEALGVTVDDPYDGSQMPKFFENREWDKIETHVKGDVRGSVEMFLKRRDLMMDVFFDHYDINASGSPTPEVSFDELGRQ